MEKIYKIFYMEIRFNIVYYIVNTTEYIDNKLDC